MKSLVLPSNIFTNASEHAGLQQADEVTAQVALAKGGDRQAFEWLIHEYKSFVAREARKFVPFHAVEDVAQEAFIRLYRSLPDYREEGRFAWWLKRLVVHSSLDMLRKERRNDSLKGRVLEDQVERVTTEDADANLLLDLERLLSDISPVDQMVAVLVFFEGNSHQDAAALLEMSVVAVKVRIFRLRKKLSEKFGA